MIEVIVYKIPDGDRTRTTQIGRIEIVNDETGTLEKGNYEAQLFPEKGKACRHTRIFSFMREKHTVFHLLSLVLNSLLRGTWKEEKPCCEAPGKQKCDQCQETGLANSCNH